MKVYRKVKQTKFTKDGLEGLLTIHDHGGIAVSLDHKALFNELSFDGKGSYLHISKPSTEEKTIVLNRLFDL